MRCLLYFAFLHVHVCIYYFEWKENQHDDHHCRKSNERAENKIDEIAHCDHQLVALWDTTAGAAGALFHCRECHRFAKFHLEQKNGQKAG